MNPDALSLRLSPSNNGSGATAPGRRLAREVSPAVRAAVWNRGLHVCHYCGFRSTRYQAVVVLGDSTRDVDQMKTACQFCHQCLHLGEVAELRSGVLIWLPELSQEDLHHVAREIYLARLTHQAGKRAQRALDALMARREAVRERLGTDDPKLLCERLAAAKSDPAQALDDALRAGVRLLPLDRRIMRVEDLEFNQFPQVLAFWRSNEGPYRGVREFEWIGALERALEPDAAAAAGAPSNGDGEAEEAPTHASLAVRLLRDAAHFFANVAEQNPVLGRQMTENAGVYRQLADLLERDPRSELSVAPGSPVQEAEVAALAARLLEDAATFFEAVGRQNEPLREQMGDNASVYRNVADLIRSEPLGRLEFDD